jgi:hypothetical protein
MKKNFRKGVFKMCKGEIKFGPPETWEFIKKIFKNKTKFHARSVCFRSIQQHHMDKAREKNKEIDHRYLVQTLIEGMTVYFKYYNYNRCVKYLIVYN